MGFSPIIGPPLAPTYVAETASISGSDGKIHLGIFNPANSGLTVVIANMFVASDVVLSTPAFFEIRRSSAQSSGTALTPQKMETADGAAVATPATTPTVTDVAKLRSVAMPAGSAQVDREFRYAGDGIKPIVLAPGEGLYIKQVGTSGLANFRTAFLWTEQ